MFSTFSGPLFAIRAADNGAVSVAGTRTVASEAPVASVLIQQINGCNHEIKSAEKRNKNHWIFWIECAFDLVIIYCHLLFGSSWRVK